MNIQLKYKFGEFKINKLYFIFSLAFTLSYAQTQYSQAPEFWSIPEKVAVISNWGLRTESPSISFDRQKLYIDAGGIAVTELADTGWTKPYPLNNNINQHLARWPSISPNGKRIFFSWYIGGWDLYYSDWDSTINDWGPAISCGPNVNNPEETQFTGSLPNDSTLIFLRSTETHVSHWDSEKGIWGSSEKWPTPDFWFQSDKGIYVSPDFNKVYLTRANLDTTIEGTSYLNYNIVVRYADSTFTSGYGLSQIINFCLYADTQYFAGNYKDRTEGFPTLTPDGKKMYFTANYHGQVTIYESDLLIDENGNPVSIGKNNQPGRALTDMILLPAYPNPFNSEIKIKYSIANPININITMYNVVGQKIAKIYQGRKNSGNYEITINAEKLKLSSGTYIVVLESRYRKISQKLIYIK